MATISMPHHLDGTEQVSRAAWFPADIQGLRPQSSFLVSLNHRILFLTVVIYFIYFIYFFACFSRMKQLSHALQREKVSVWSLCHKAHSGGLY